MKTTILALSALMAAGQAAAQTAVACDWRARASALAEPWSENTATFANGKVRLALLDTGEPVSGAYHILILSPPYGELGDRQCRALSLGKEIGFAGLDFSTLESAYDPATGLIFTMDAKRYDGGAFLPARLRFTLNQATGQIRGTLR